ncbi:MAG: glycolate oxidase subunit GlcF [Gammaproteobacteria bacterium]
MQTWLEKQLLATRQGREAEKILRSCVHCGFCNATCPTYQLLGDELDGPRGRIYLIKQMLEGAAAGRNTQQHLDRCLTCRSCESTCPSGVEYSRLLDIGRSICEQRVKRPLSERQLRWILRKVLPYPRRLGPLLRLSNIVKPLLPKALKQLIPPFNHSSSSCTSSPANIRHQRQMILLDGCVQSVTNPGINEATVRVLDRLGISVIRPDGGGCCGAVSHHLAAHKESVLAMRKNINAWWSAIQNGCEAIISSSSACTSMLKAYQSVLSEDVAYADKAREISSRVRDLSEIIDAEDLGRLKLETNGMSIAFHASCSLQHGLQKKNVVENILERCGYELTQVRDAHLCCGAGGTNTILQKSIARQLLADKLASLEEGQPALIATANIGCLLQLQSGTRLPVKHWIELLEQ